MDIFVFSFFQFLLRVYTSILTPILRHVPQNLKIDLFLIRKLNQIIQTDILSFRIYSYILFSDVFVFNLWYEYILI